LYDSVINNNHINITIFSEIFNLLSIITQFKIENIFPNFFNKKLLILVICIFSFGFSFSQEKVYMPYVEIINIPKHYQNTFTELFQYSIDTSLYEIILPIKQNSITYKKSEKSIVIKAEEYQSNYFVILRIE